VIKSMRMRWALNLACMGEMRNAYNILVGRRSGRRWENIRIDLREIGWQGVN
jgi:hypothetical protein